jgi:hypothetical protein
VHSSASQASQKARASVASASRPHSVALSVGGGEGAVARDCTCCKQAAGAAARTYFSSP